MESSAGNRESDHTGREPVSVDVQKLRSNAVNEPGCGSVFTAMMNVTFRHMNPLNSRCPVDTPHNRRTRQTTGLVYSVTYTGVRGNA